MRGGCTPGGSWRRIACETAVTWELARRTSAPRLQEDFDDTDAGQGIGFDMLDVIDC